jgi:hypothetical protein
MQKSVYFKLYIMISIPKKNHIALVSSLAYPNLLGTKGYVVVVVVVVPSVQLI